MYTNTATATATYTLFPIKHNLWSHFRSPNGKDCGRSGRAGGSRDYMRQNTFEEKRTAYTHKRYVVPLLLHGNNIPKQQPKSCKSFGV